MANLFKQLKALQTNIFGGPGNTGETKPPATRVQDIDLQSSPTGILGTDPFSSHVLNYPLDVQQNFQNGHYMIFYVNVQDKTKYKYKARDDDTGIMKDLMNAKIKGLSKKEARYARLQAIKTGRPVGAKNAGKGDSTTYQTITGGPPGQEDQVIETDHSTKKGVSSAFNNTRRISDSVAIYLPPNVEDSTTANYNDSKTGIAGFLVATGAAAMGGDATQIAKSLVAGTEGILKDQTARAIGAVAELAGAEGAEQLVKKAFGEADNPYMEVLFDSMSLRTFTYNFNFAPKSEQEAEEVQRIIQLFRFHMAPELRPGINRYLGLPSQFDIHYMFLSKAGHTSENNFYNRIATCVLQDCKVNYTPNGVKSFEDGGPTATTMTLTFKEIELLTKDKIAEGF
jgi:hypothetical protein